MPKGISYQTSSRSLDIVTNPSMAFYKLLKLDYITLSKRLKRINSYYSTVFMEF